MLPQLGHIVTLSVMTVLVALFTWIYLRDRQPHVHLWLIGWAAILVHFAAGMLASFSLLPPRLDDWLAYSTLLAAASAFFLSVSNIRATARKRLSFFLLLVLPSLLYWTCMVFEVRQTWLYRGILVLLLCTGTALALPYSQRWTGIQYALFSLSVALGVWSCCHLVPNAELGMDFILFEAFALTGYLFCRFHRRSSPGVYITSLAFCAWGLVFPLGSMCDILHVNIPAGNVIWDLPKYFVAFGMILSLYENQTEVLQREIAVRKRAEESAKAADEAKSSFLATMSHEIRTPMHGIIGLTDLLLDTRLTQDQREDLTLVKDSAESLLLIINDVLDFSKIESGKLTCETILFSVHESLNDVIRAMRFRAQQKNLNLTFSCSGNVPSRLLGDPGRLRQVLVNLIGNAIKFTSEGEVRVGVEREFDGRDDVLLRFWVRDTGIGIPPEKRALIFQPFTQADASTTRRFGGTGLGLAISAKLAGLMGGRLWVEDGPNRRGSVFHFTARLGRAAEAPAPAEKTNALTAAQG